MVHVLEKVANGDASELGSRRDAEASEVGHRQLREQSSRIQHGRRCRVLLPSEATLCEAILTQFMGDSWASEW